MIMRRLSRLSNETWKYMILLIIISTIVYSSLYTYQPFYRLKDFSFDISSGKFYKNWNSTLGFDHIYVINSSSHSDRMRDAARDKMRYAAHKLDLKLDVFPAISYDDDHALEEFYPDSKLDFSYKATYIDHYRIYQSIIRNRYRNALILDDNLDFEFNITSIMFNVHKILPADWDLLYLGFCNRWEGVYSNPLPDDNNSSVYKIFESKRPYCTYAYAVSSTGALKLMKNLVPTTFPIDFDLVNMIQSEQVSSYTIVPPLIVQLRPFEGENFKKFHSKFNIRKIETF